MFDEGIKTGSSSGSAGLLLRVRHASGQTDEFYLANGLTIGRTVANTVVLADDDAVDRTHAWVDLTEDGSAKLRCVGTDNKISVGDTTVQEVCLTAGVRFNVGATKFECVSGRKASEPPLFGSTCPACGSHTLPPPCKIPVLCPGCGQPILVLSVGTGFPSPLVLPVKYGEYQAERYMARGGMGLILFGFAEESKRLVAIKVLLPGRDVDKQATARFEQEINLMKRVSHPNVVAILGDGRSGPFSFLVMDWITGRSLRDVILDFQRRRQLPEFPDVLHWFVQVCKGLAAVHAVGIIHRDIKPSNILVAQDGHVLLADLGVGKRADTNQTALTTTGQLPGTFEYMAPEQLSAPDTVDQRTDLYPLGVTFHELLTGERPVGAWLPASQVNATVPRTFDQILSRLLAPRPDNRYSDVHDVLAAITVFKAPRNISRVEPQLDAAIVLAEFARPQSISGDRCFGDLTPSLGDLFALSSAHNTAESLDQVQSRDEGPLRLFGESEAGPLNLSKLQMLANYRIVPSSPHKPSMCPLCGKEDCMSDAAGLLYGHPVGRRCFYEFAIRRQLAFVLDVIAAFLPMLAVLLIILPQFPVMAPAAQGAERPGFWVFFVVFILLSRDSDWRRTWTGKKMCGIQVVDQTTGKTPTDSALLKRNLPLLIPFVPIMAAIQLHRGYRIGDGWSHTKVIWTKFANHPIFAVNKPISGQLENENEPEKRTSFVADKLMLILTAIAVSVVIAFVGVMEERDRNAYSEGMKMLDHRNFDAAKQEFTRAIAFEPKSAQAYLMRAVAHSEMREYNEAIDDCNAAIRIDPNYAAAYNTRGEVYRNLGRNDGLADGKHEYDNAITDCTEAIRLNPQLSIAFYIRGEVYRIKGESAKAEADFAEAKRLGWKSD